LCIFRFNDRNCKCRGRSQEAAENAQHAHDWRSRIRRVVSVEGE
jgi:hypothetical protein